jgi:hypothetical protein
MAIDEGTNGAGSRNTVVKRAATNQILRKRLVNAGVDGFDSSRRLLSLIGYRVRSS